MILVDGKRSDSVPADDRGLAYGDGVFETLRARNGKLPLIERHLERLYRGLAVLRIPAIEREVLVDELLSVAARFPDGIVKLVVTRGSGGRGYRMPARIEPRRIVQGMPAPDHVGRWQRDGVTLTFCETQLSGPSALAGLKHLNRLPQVLARAEWGDEFDEGVMCNSDGHHVEGTMSNLFVVHDGALVAPPVDAGVAGVMRALVIELAGRSRLAVSETPLAGDRLMAADEIFITNSVIGVCGARRIGDRDIAVGTITRRLQSAVDEELSQLS